MYRLFIFYFLFFCLQLTVSWNSYHFFICCKLFQSWSHQAFQYWMLYGFCFSTDYLQLYNMLFLSAALITFLSAAHSFLSLFYLLQTFFRAGRTKYAHLHDTGPIDTAPALWEMNPETPSFSAHLSHMGPTSILERSSTPLHSFINNNSQQLEPSTLNKISMMEEELAALRKQIADLVMMQETKPQGWCHLTVI